MTMTSWPYTAQDTTDIEYGRLYREIDEGIVSNVGENALQPFGDATGMTVKVRAGSAILRGYMFMSTATETLPVTPAGATIRYDRVVLELNLSEPTIQTRIRLRVISGASTPPALSQTDTGVYQMSLAIIQVDPNISSIAAAKVVDDRDWVGSKVSGWISNARRPKNPRKYKMGFNEATGVYEYWNGTDWVNLVSVNLASSAVTNTLPINRGGTGATTAMTALNALGIYIQAAAPAFAENRVWIKKPA